jgi:hypothetical protein
LNRRIKSIYLLATGPATWVLTRVGDAEPSLDRVKGPWFRGRPLDATTTGLPIGDLVEMLD